MGQLGSRAPVTQSFVSNGTGALGGIALTDTYIIAAARMRRLSPVQGERVGPSDRHFFGRLFFLSRANNYAIAHFLDLGGNANQPQINRNSSLDASTTLMGTNTLLRRGLGDVDLFPTGTEVWVVDRSCSCIRRVSLPENTLPPRELGTLNLPFNAPNTVSDGLAFWTDPVAPDNIAVFVATIRENQGRFDLLVHRGLFSPGASSIAWTEVASANLSSIDRYAQLQLDNGMTPNQSWFSWSAPLSNQYMPKPYPVNISLAAHGQTMVVSLRDATHDEGFDRYTGTEGWLAGTGGDALVFAYNPTTKTWSLRNRPNAGDRFNWNRPDTVAAASTDIFNDNLHFRLISQSRAAHVENFLGGSDSMPAMASLAGELRSQWAFNSTIAQSRIGVSLFPINNVRTPTALGVVPDNAGGNPSWVRSVPGASVVINDTKLAYLGDIEFDCRWHIVNGQVWRDNNNNGIRDQGDDVVPGVTLELVRDGRAVAAVQTDRRGAYRFALIPGAAYRIVVRTMPAGLDITLPHQGSNRETDSDADPADRAVHLTADRFQLSATQPRLSRPWVNVVTSGVDIGLRASTTTLAVSKTGPSVATIGELATYTIMVRNTGNVPAREIAVVDRFPDNVTYASSSPQATISADRRSASWSIPSLDPGRSWNATITLRMPDRIPRPQQAIVNTVSASAQNAAQVDGRAETVVQSPDYTVSIVGPRAGPPSSTQTYQVYVRNLGAAVATNVRLTIEDDGAGLVQVNIPRLEPNTPHLVPYTTTLSPLSAGQITITAFVHDDPFPTSGSPDRASITTRSVSADPRIVKTGPVEALAGSVIEYTLRVSNGGNIASDPATMLTDTLPAGARFVRATDENGNPIAATASGSTVRIPVGSIPPGGNRIARITTRMPELTTRTTITNRAEVGPDPYAMTGNRSEWRTTITTPDPAITSIEVQPDPLTVGQPSTVLIAYRNNGTAIAEQTTIRVTVPTGIDVISMPPFCRRDGQEVACVIGNVSPQQNGRLDLTIQPNASSGSRGVLTAVISTASLELPILRNNNTLQREVTIDRPDVRIGITGPSSIVGYGSVFPVVLTYSNRTVHQSAIAESVTIELQLPNDASFVGSNPPPAATAGNTLRWNLGRLQPNQSGQITLVLQTSVPAGATLPLSASIATTSPGDNPANNRASTSVPVVQPPSSIGQADTTITLAVHSALDPSRRVYYLPLAGTESILWPIGETLFFTPIVDSVTVPGQPLPWPYEYRARVVGWSLESVSFDQTTRPGTKDYRNRPCRSESIPGTTLRGCVFSYIGPDEIGSQASIQPSTIVEQGKIHWTYLSSLIQENTNAYVAVRQAWRNRDAPAASFTIQVELEVWIVNAAPGSVSGIPLPPIYVAPLPDPQRQIVTQRIPVRLVAMNEQTNR